MNANSATQQNESGIQTDLNRYKQAAELAYRYAKDQSDEQKTKKESSSPFEEDKKESTKDKEDF